MSFLSNIKNSLIKIAWNYGVEIRSKHYYLNFTRDDGIKFLYFKDIFDKIQFIKGDVVECGVARGESLLMFCILSDYLNQNRKVYGFDSFEGFPEPSNEDRTTQEALTRNVQKGHDKAPEEVARTFLHYNLNSKKYGDGKEYVKKNVQLIKGYFEDTLDQYQNNEIALLHIDADLYLSYKTVLNGMYSKVMDGGIIMFDEYESKKFPGAKKAVDEFFEDKPNDLLQQHEKMGKYYVIKNEKNIQS